jgi:hypothetical protein
MRVLANDIHQLPHPALEHFDFCLKCSISTLDITRLFYKIFLLSLLLASAFARGLAILLEVDSSCRTNHCEL